MAVSNRILIVGQGISGTMLSWFCHRAGIDFLVINQSSAGNSPSKTAAGLINPVTGRRVVTAWMDDIILPFAETSYKELGSFLSTDTITKTAIIDFFPNPFMKESFLKKLNQDAPYIRLIDDNGYMQEYFKYEFGVGAIEPAYFVHLSSLLSAWEAFLRSQQKLVDDLLDFSKLELSDTGVSYDGIKAGKIIFCDGVQGADNPYFSRLPFALNKGEALIIEIPDLPADRIYKKSLTLVPYREGSVFWAGTNYTWDFDNDQPTESFRKATEQTLAAWLKLPFKVVDHKAAIRPATVERRPFAGLHPKHKNIGILNGMGTKGCSLAPYFAHQLLENILKGAPIEREADIARHSGILSRAL